jgi:hypothetical protein
MSETRQPELPTPLVRDAQRLVAQLAEQMPKRAAVAWVYAGALAQHARTVRLGVDALTCQAAVEQIADLHPALECWTDPAINPMWDHKPDTAGQAALDDLWQRHTLPGADTTNVPWWSYPLGDLYQSLSDEARKGRALCQTPWFVGQLLLDLSYNLAVHEWDDDPQVIDPACGAGHLLVESVMRAASPVVRSRRPSLPLQEAFGTVHGVDVDPLAVAIARYRLVVLGWAQIQHRTTLAGLRDLPVQVACADSLLATDEPLLARGRYHVVVGNPPYIVVKDKAHNEAIRAAYPQVCHRKYSLALPFAQLMTELAVPGGWVAQLTANSFMKREFGEKFVEKYLPRFDLQWVIDTSGAYIPGHGTPTVILAHRNQPPQQRRTVHTVLGKRGEPAQPANPADGLVWRAIEDAVRSRLSAERFVRGAQEAYERDHPALPTEASPPVDIATPRPVQPSLFELLETA